MSKKLSVISQTDASDKQWIEICRKVSYSTFFHTPLWADVFCNSSKKQYEKAAKIIEFSDGKTVLFPCVTKKVSVLVKVTLSMPAATFGGWLSTEPLHKEHMKLLLENLGEYKDLILRENPYDPHLSSIQMQHAKNDSTQTVCLEGGYDTVFQNSEKRHQRAVNTAVKKGVWVKEAAGADQWSEYYQIYLKSIKRWKKRNLFSGVSYSKKFFDSIYNLDSSYRKLFLAYVEDEPVAGMLCFYWNNHAVMWHGAGLSEFFAYRPNNLLYDQAIHNACDNKFQWFDCNPSGGLDGVIRFKKYLGAKLLKSRIIEHRSWIRTIARFARKIAT